MDAKEPKPCPFCGSSNISAGEVLTVDRPVGTATQSMCRDCGSLGPEAHLQDGEVDYGDVKATAAWNRRAALSAPAEAMQAGVVPAGWRMRMDADGAAVIQKDGVGGAVVTAKDEEISGAILHALVRDMLAAAPQAPVATRVEAMPTEEARRLVQHHANAARALEHMHTEKNVERLKAISAELVGILVAAQAPVADAVRGEPVLSHADETVLAKEYDLDESTIRELWAEFCALTAPTRQPARASEAGEVHFDDAAVNVFASAMMGKLAQAREKGRSGWEACDPVNLSWMLHEHVEKGDPIDVANFCMFLWHLGAPITPAAQHAVRLTDDPRDGDAK